MAVTAPTIQRAPKLSSRVEQARWEFSLPEAARKSVSEGVLRGGSTDSLMRWFSVDRDIAHHVLRWCNTSFFNLSRPFRSLSEASQMVDFSDMARLALMADLRRRLMNLDENSKLVPAALWRHSVAVGTVASMIARTCGVPNASDAMLAGAMHDLGVAVMAGLHPGEYRQVVEDVDQLSALHEVERDLYQWDHGDLGFEILRAWQMPESVQLAAKLHHQAEASILACDDPIVSSVVIANYLCSRTGWGSFSVHNLATPGDGIFRHLDIGPEMLVVIWNQLNETLEQSADMMC